MTRWKCVTVSAVAVLVGLLGALSALADALPFLPAGDARLRHFVEIEADNGAIALGTTWPISTLDLPPAERATLHSSLQPGTSADAGWFVSGAVHPDPIRTFDDTPRDKAEIGLRAGWAAGDYAGGVIRLSYVLQPTDGMHYRFDDTYVAWRLGNWWVSAGQQQRWWGPGWDGSLILSNNARPMPSISLDRASSEPFATKWLSWIGPWRLTTFMGEEQHVSAKFPHPLFWGLRVTAKPLRDLEIGLSRTAQWCYVHVCRLHTFEDVLLGKDNAGSNIAVSQQPGNQELDWDLRWHLGTWPSAVYWQIQGETADGRYPLFPRPRQTTNLIGAELWSRGSIAGSWRTFVEWTDTTCGELSTAKSDTPTPGCAYSNNLITFGYYYRDRVIGHSLQGDGHLLTLGGLYIDAHDRTWDLRLRKGTVNRFSLSDVNTLSPVKASLWSFEGKVDSEWRGLVISAGIGAERINPIGGSAATTGNLFLSISSPWR